MPKSYWKAFALALLFGPLGLLYTSPPMAVGVVAIVFLASSAEVLFFFWLLSIVVNLFLVSRRNREYKPKRQYWVYEYATSNPAIKHTETVPDNVRPFPGIENILLSFRDLQEIVEKPQAHREWHKALSSVNGVYAILHQSSGKVYIGSASGKRGIIGRWEDYVPEGHGDNLALQELLQKQPDAKRDFCFSVLCTLPKYMSTERVVAEESLWKDKLGTRLSGFNLN